MLNLTENIAAAKCYPTQIGHTLGTSKLEVPSSETRPLYDTQICEIGNTSLLFSEMTIKIADPKDFASKYGSGKSFTVNRNARRIKVGSKLKSECR